jgi:hypothetical protein
MCVEGNKKEYKRNTKGIEAIQKGKGKVKSLQEYHSNVK